MKELFLVFIESATKKEIEELIDKLEVEENRNLEELILFLASLL
jgi:low affinity Fe/Cu permease